MHEKTINLGSDQVQHNQGQKLEISDSRRRGIVLIRVAKTKALICVFVFTYADCWFSHEAAQVSFSNSLLSKCYNSHFTYFSLEFYTHPFLNSSGESIPYEKFNRIPLVVQLDKDRSQCGI